MLGIDFFEIVVIVVIGVIILGPEHMPRVAFQIGKWSAKMRSAASQLGEAITQDEELSNLKREIDEGRNKLGESIKTAKKQNQSLSARLNAAVLTEAQRGNVTQTLVKAKPEASQETQRRVELKTCVYETVVADIPSVASLQSQKTLSGIATLPQNQETDPSVASPQSQKTVSGIAAPSKTLDFKTLFATAQVQVYAEEDIEDSAADMPTLCGHALKLQNPAPLDSHWLTIPDKGGQTLKLEKVRLLPEVLSRQTTKKRYLLAKPQTTDNRHIAAHALTSPREGLGFLSGRALSAALPTPLKQQSYQLLAPQSTSAQAEHVVLAPSKRPS